ncbi:hypothetical protein FHX52_1731 [Humibacillus xanthopallidus]|uniref:Uncharacterized protein n=1 Tax=Humibacillus xanthopallidus TaxID=412689 RepID=A0A543PWY4_9MICO|nr:hypothetical protein FHX52_1731 [Humibacillus xanthopallidus]
MNRHTTAIASRSFVSKRSGPRIAAAAGASAALSLVLVGPAFSSQPLDPPPSHAAAQCENYLGAGRVGPCRQSSNVYVGGAASSNSAARNLPASADAPKSAVGSGQPTDPPVIGVGAAVAVVVAGGLWIASLSRRRTA